MAPAEALAGALVEGALGREAAPGTAAEAEWAAARSEAVRALAALQRAVPAARAPALVPALRLALRAALVRPFAPGLARHGRRRWLTDDENGGRRRRARRGRWRRGGRTRAGRCLGSGRRGTKRWRRSSPRTSRCSAAPPLPVSRHVGRRGRISSPAAKASRFLRSDSVGSCGD